MFFKKKKPMTYIESKIILLLGTISEELAEIKEELKKINK